MRSHTHKQTIILLAVIIGLSAAGLTFYFVSKASTPYIVAEPETGTNTGCSSVVTDTTASGGGATKFKPCQVTFNFSVASWNSASLMNTSTNLKADMQTLMGRVDILGFQEMHDPAARQTIRDALFCSSCKYAGYVPKNDYTSRESTSPFNLPIVWDKSKFSLVSTGYVKVSDRVTGIDDATGNNMNVSAKWIDWVKLTEKTTGITFYFMNTHTVASVETGGQPNNNTERLALYSKHMDVLVAKLKQFKAENIPILIAGDFNVNYRKDVLVQYKNFPYARLAPLGVRSNWELVNLAGIDPSWATSGTGSRIIDYVFSLDNPYVKASSVAIYADMYGSDHHPAVFRLSFIK